MNLIYVGNKFYSKSNSAMSPIYEVYGGKLTRSDWGLVEIALEQGKEINIRQATDEEMLWAYKKLVELK